ncbi:R3H domain-containing protein [Mycena chlorophos]|uniref:R3H domain-containing protein n=1 Tax=Mycena chlorophos TaxID=658473 RepID=A0A8H6SL54_MYCCL|nr:R3H domain-containing protein [Mycena chlorophos]
MRRALVVALLVASAAAQSLSIPNPLICEDTIDGSAPFQSIDIPCIVGCDCEIVHATLSFLPGNVNTTCYPYCNLNCVRPNATPEQTALAPSCWDTCSKTQAESPENLGWCMYWCVDGYSSVVTAATCVPSIGYGSETTTVIDGITESFKPFTNPPAWQSWYLTQTVIPRTGTASETTSSGPAPTPVVAPSTTQTRSSSIPTSSSTAASNSGQAEADTASNSRAVLPNPTPVTPSEHKRHPKCMDSGPANPAHPPESTSSGRSNNNNRRNRQRPRDANNQQQHHADNHGPRSAQDGQQRPSRGGGSGGGGRRPPPANVGHEADTNHPRPNNRRGAKFNSGLTTTDAAGPAPRHSHPRARAAEPVADDLTSRLTAALGTPPYPDCPICFTAIHPAQPTWSCSPEIAVLDAPQYCWTTFHLKCINTAAEQAEILCEKQCSALRACGRHRCLRVCCPLASVAALQQKAKGKKRVAHANENEVAIGEEPGGLHECDLVCGKMLGCGLHRFEELICSCGLTVLEPPIPCGTVIQCPHPCSRPPPTCGHPRTPHSCHPDSVSCPPCPFLTSKKCMCGKKVVGNVRCSQERVGCGAVCGKVLGCGAHTCERVCHAPEGVGDDGGCGPCSAPCGKPRRLCHPAQHPCTAPCHAPSACDESTPCTAVITVSCPCLRIRQQVQCGKSTANPAGRREQAIKCTNDCLVAKRNARLAEALGITAESRDKLAEVTWSDEVKAFGKANGRFVGVVEKAFADFVNSDKKTQVLPHMPPDRRKFVHDVAANYRMDTQMVDQEPHRSVRLLKRYDTKVPSPLLSSVLGIGTVPAPSGGLGKLADLSKVGGSWRAPTKAVEVAKPVASAPRGWGQPPTPAVTPPPPPPPVASTSTPPPTRPPGIHVPLPAARVAPPAATPTAVPEDWEDDD